MADPPPRQPVATSSRRWWIASLLLVGIIGAGLWRTVRSGSQRPSPTLDVPAVTAVARLGSVTRVTEIGAATAPPEASVPILPVLDAAMKARLQAIHAVGLAHGMRSDVLAKVGDSITVDGSFLAEFGCSDGQLGAYRSLAPTIAYFRSTELPRTRNYARCVEQNSLTRVGPAAGNGWSSVHILQPFRTMDPTAILSATLAAESVINAVNPVSDTVGSVGEAEPEATAPAPTIEVTGPITATGALSATGALTATGAMTATLRPPPPTATPPPECQAPDNTPLRCEIKVIRPGVAVVMFGTNDVEVGFKPQVFAANLDHIVEELVSAGVIPILSTIPPRTDREAANIRVSDFNMAIVAVAQARGVPLVNFWRALSGPDMVSRGMEADGIHPNDVDFGGSFTARGLRYGQNQRNLTVLQTLDKLRRIVYQDGAPEP